jgi:hypothetical protein
MFEYSSTPSDRGKALRLSCRNADIYAAGILNWNILVTITASICLLNEILINPGQAFQLANQGYHRTEDKLLGAAQP